MTDSGAPPFYQQPDAGTVRPGDVFRLAPCLFPALKVLLHVGQEQRRPKSVTAVLHGDGMPAGIPPAVVAGEREARLAVPAQFTFAVLLTRGCDVDHGKVRQLALVRPLTDVSRVEDRVAVIEGRHSSLFYMPEGTINATEKLPEGFLDFRHVVTLHKDLLARLQRCLALTPDGLMDLYFGWLRHTVGPQAVRTRPCPTCGYGVQVFQLVDEMMRPPDDY